MSVMVLHDKHYQRNFESCFYAYSKITYGSHIDYNRLKTIFKNLYTLNVKSYNKLYKENGVLELNLSDAVLKNIDLHPNFCSLLKSLECLEYQIELNEIKDNITAEEKNAYKFLTDYIEKLKAYIINNLDDYKAAYWS
jgi:hypothetical protein